MGDLFQGFDLPIGETLLRALVGFVIVFLVLVLLVGILYLFKYVFAINFKKKAPIAAESEDDEETVAAITAAITELYRSESAETGEGPAAVPKFVIRSYKKIK